VLVREQVLALNDRKKKTKLEITRSPGNHLGSMADSPRQSVRKLILKTNGLQKISHQGADCVDTHLFLQILENRRVQPKNVSQHFYKIFNGVI
jgi:hypothetical protein